MDNSKQTGPGDGGGDRAPAELGSRKEVATVSTPRPGPSPMEKEATRKPAERLRMASDRWSQEENSAVNPSEVGQVLHLPSAQPITNGITAINGIHKVQPGVSVASAGLESDPREKRSEQSLLNNNLIEDKCNLRCADEKSYCLYHKFPAKVNNNVYPEKGSSGKDGMDEYFQMNASPSAKAALPYQPQTTNKRNELSPSRDSLKYPDQLNLLNGEEEDEDDGCIYTYKGENFEANLSHLIDMCLSCGLPNTERSVDGRGLINGIPRQDPPDQNNLFSPEMDFLEMDFDPGPNGDGAIDSDCEDNCLDQCDSRLIRDNSAAFSVLGALNPISLVDRKANNYCPEMRNLMCKRCESSIRDSKIDNVALNLSVHENSSVVDFGRGPSAGLDDRPAGGNSGILNVPRDEMNLSKDCNVVGLNQFSGASCSGVRAQPSQEESYDPADNDSVENNLGEGDMDMIEDDYGDDADDEDGDDSNSERYEVGARYPRSNGSCVDVPGAQKEAGAAESSAATSSMISKINKATNKPHKTTNNNLGSVSAPENMKPGCEGIAPASHTQDISGGSVKCTGISSSQGVVGTSHSGGVPSSPTQCVSLFKNSSVANSPVIGSAAPQPCPLPVKSLRPKNTNPAQDPNTASEGEGGGEESCPRVKKVMIWTELQASARQVTQIATSACGATAIINVLLALDYPCAVEEVQASIKTRLRAETAPVVDYLLSRSVAGTTHRDLIEGVNKLAKGTVKAKFFHMFPKRAVQLSRWLAQWISRGGVPLATLNLQVGVAPGQTTPDAWHHQMIFGVGPQGIYLTNPLECVSDCLLGDQLCSESVLLVRRADIVSRWGQGDKLIRLTQQSDPRWRDMNVLGQVVGVLKEQAAPPVVQGRRHLTSHVAIPAAYQSGITIFMRSDNPHMHTLTQAEELPLLE